MAERMTWSSWAASTALLRPKVPEDFCVLLELNLGAPGKLSCLCCKLSHVGASASCFSNVISIKRVNIFF